MILKRSLVSVPLAFCLTACAVSENAGRIGGAAAGAGVGAVVGKQLGAEKAE